MLEESRTGRASAARVGPDDQKRWHSMPRKAVLWDRRPPPAQTAHCVLAVSTRRPTRGSAGRKLLLLLFSMRRDAPAPPARRSTPRPVRCCCCTGPRHPRGVQVCWRRRTAASCFAPLLLQLLLLQHCQMLPCATSPRRRAPVCVAVDAPRPSNAAAGSASVHRPAAPCSSWRAPWLACTRPGQALKKAQQQQQSMIEKKHLTVAFLREGLALVQPAVVRGQKGAPSCARFAANVRTIWESKVRNHFAEGKANTRPRRRHDNSPGRPPNNRRKFWIPPRSRENSVGRRSEPLFLSKQTLIW